MPSIFITNTRLNCLIKISTDNRFKIQSDMHPKKSLFTVKNIKILLHFPIETVHNNYDPFFVSSSPKFNFLQVMNLELENGQESAAV